MQERSGQVRENRVKLYFGGIFFWFSWVRLGLVRFGAGLGFGGLAWAERYGYWDGMRWDGMMHDPDQAGRVSACRVGSVSVSG